MVTIEGMKSRKKKEAMEGLSNGCMVSRVTLLGG